MEALLNAHPGLVAMLIDAVIVFALLEGVVLVVRRRVTGKGPAWRDYGLNLLSGLCLMLALRCLAHGSSAAWVAACLLGAGLAHGAGMAKLLR